MSKFSRQLMTGCALLLSLCVVSSADAGWRKWCSGYKVKKRWSCGCNYNFGCNTGCTTAWNACGSGACAPIGNTVQQTNYHPDPSSAPAPVPLSRDDQTIQTENNTATPSQAPAVDQTVQPAAQPPADNAAPGATATTPDGSASAGTDGTDPGVNANAPTDNGNLDASANTANGADAIASPPTPPAPGN